MSATDSRDTRLVNPFEQEGAWYKANLHTHTTTSDGEVGVVDRVRQYREHGYSVLAITDHAATNDLSGLSSPDFLALSGIETHPEDEEGGNCYHLVCLDVPLDIEFPEASNANERIEIVRKLGGEVIFAHPYWCGQNISHLLKTQGYIGIEVFNATCTKIGKGFSSVQWDDVLLAGRPMPAVAVDDTHSGRDIFMGWTMIKSPALTVEAVMAALKSGCYYASCGPTIEDFRVSEGKAVLRCSPVVEAHFMGKRATGYSVYTDGGDPITSAESDVNADMSYVRAEVVDCAGRRAWTNPIYLDGEAK